VQHLARKSRDEVGGKWTVSSSTGSNYAHRARVMLQLLLSASRELEVLSLIWLVIWKGYVNRRLIHPKERVLGIIKEKGRAIKMNEGERGARKRFS
jgi:hypothetical protein